MKQLFMALEAFFGQVPRPALYMLALMWFGIICYLSHLPAATSTSTKVMVDGDDTLNVVFRFCAHIGVFGIQGILLYGAWKRSLGFSWREFSLTLIAVFILGAIDEVHQSYVPGRYGRLQDVFTDTLGAIICIVGLSRVRKAYNLD